SLCSLHGICKCFEENMADLVTLHLLVTIGRGLGVTYQLTCSSCPLMISRVHCILRQNKEGEWTITDNKSLNGVWLNQEKLEPRRAHVLCEGTCIKLGVPPPNADKVEFEYDVVKESSSAQASTSWRAVTKDKGSKTKRKSRSEEPELGAAEGSSGSSKTKFPRSSKACREPGLSPRVAKPHTGKDEVDEDRLAPTQQVCRSTAHLDKVRHSMVEIRRLNKQMQEMQEKMNSPQQSDSVDPKDVLLVQIQLRDLQNQLSNEQEHHLHHIQELKQIFQDEQKVRAGSPARVRLTGNSSPPPPRRSPPPPPLVSRSSPSTPLRLPQLAFHPPLVSRSSPSHPLSSPAARLPTPLVSPAARLPTPLSSPAARLPTPSRLPQLAFPPPSRLPQLAFPPPSRLPQLAFPPPLVSAARLPPHSRLPQLAFPPPSRLCSSPSHPPLVSRSSPSHPLVSRSSPSHPLSSPHVSWGQYIHVSWGKSIHVSWGNIYPCELGAIYISM
uniref:FHA domain-containing protein n=1 Tax=Leptobrachium leishanense TaxID=445787 RepID=A0A8C5MU25_9ANUR